MQAFAPNYRSLGSWMLALAVLTILPLARLHAQDDGNGAPPDQSQSPSPDNGQDVSFQTFYDSLSSQGQWVQTDDYGYVWQPSVSDSQWAPYTNGHWVYTDDGWTWVSDDSWGWATDHYGRWVNLDGSGWCWVPGYTWAPAWVSWRYGNGYCGWAPLPPDSLVGVDYSNGNVDYGVGFHIGGDCDSYYGIGAGWYNFLPVVYLGEPDYRGFYEHRNHNRELIHNTTNVTNLNVNRRAGSDSARGDFGRVTAGGPSLLQVNARSQTPVQRVGLAYTDRVGGGEVSGGKLSIFAPRINLSTMQGARPGASTRFAGQPKINREGNATRSVSNEAVGTPRKVPSTETGAETRKSGAPVHTADHQRSAISSMRPLGYSHGNEKTGSHSGNSRPSPYPGRSGPGYSRPMPGGAGGYRPGAGGGASHGAGGGGPGRQGH